MVKWRLNSIYRRISYHNVIITINTLGDISMKYEILESFKKILIFSYHQNFYLSQIEKSTFGKIKRKKCHTIVWGTKWGDFFKNPHIFVTILFRSPEFCPAQKCKVQYLHRLRNGTISLISLLTWQQYNVTVTTAIC